MKIVKRYLEKRISRVRQFGLPALLKLKVLSVVRPVFEIERELVMVIPNHQPTPVYYPEIRPMTHEDLENAFKSREMSESLRAALHRFLNEGCFGFFAEIDGCPAGYGFVQPNGVYNFGTSGCLHIPEGMMVLKNLHVFQNFRGQSLGKKLIQARIASIPAGQTPTVFVVPENRVNIRNLKRFGFQEILAVRRRTWFKRRTCQTVKVLGDEDKSRKLIARLCWAWSDRRRCVLPGP
ncbi:MAG: GNAT family N-acetyltransferase [Eubacteriales bacterium]|nr:GNAT family N-acetyltransferase [Eubacteriales bacterium]MDD3951757.1 GNAT family N-acetyltransferase [Desulfobacterales bacterium]